MTPPASEKSRLNDSLVLCSEVPLTLCWRNNSGMAWQGTRVRAQTGSMIRVQPGMVILKEARPVQFGLIGSGDILGVTVGQAWSIEMKDDVGRQTTGQQNFQRAFERAGGLYTVSRSPADSRAFVEAIRRGEG